MEDTQITTRMSRTLYREISNFINTKPGRRFITEADFIRDAVREKLTELKNKK